jgi:hypothetical protein
LGGGHPCICTDPGVADVDREGWFLGDSNDRDHEQG